jgi:hypothetical protein
MRAIAVLAGILSFVFFGYGYRKDMTAKARVGTAAGVAVPWHGALAG